jgi:hypothetical protein
MSSFVRRSVSAAGAVVAAVGATSVLMLGAAGAANAGEPCSGSSYCVKPPPEFSREASECVPPAAMGAAGGGAVGGPGGAAAGGAVAGATCGYNKAIE